MAVAKNAGDSGTVFKTTGFGSTAVSLDQDLYTVGAGSNVVLFALLHFNNAASTDISGLSVTWAGAAMTRIGTGLYNGARVEIWYKVSPATGAQTCAAAWTTISDCVIGLVSVTDAGTPTDLTTAQNTGVDVDITVPSDANGATLVAVSATGNLVTTGGSPSPTELYLDNSTWVAAAASYTIGGTSNQHTWVEVGTWAAMGVHIPQFTATTTTPELDHTSSHRPFNMAVSPGRM